MMTIVDNKTEDPQSSQETEGGDEQEEEQQEGKEPRNRDLNWSPYKKCLQRAVEIGFCSQDWDGVLGRQSGIALLRWVGSWNGWLGC